MLAASLAAPSIALAEANDAAIPAQLNRLNETQKAYSGETATQALDQLRASVVQAANSGKVSKDASQRALDAIDQARTALNSDSLKAVSGALATAEQQVRALEAQASGAGRSVQERAADAGQRVENRAAEAEHTVAQGAERVRDQAAGAAQTVKDKVADAAQNVRDRVAGAEQNASQQASNAGARIVRAFSELKPGDVEGKTLYDNAGNEVASVRSVRTAPDGRIEAVEIDVGGFLGIGKKQIFVPVSDLQFRDGRIEASSLTADQIRNLPQSASNEGQTLGQRAGQAGQQASDAAQSAKGKVADAAQRVEDKVSDVAQRVENKASDAAQRLKNGVTEGRQQAADAAQKPARAVSDLREDDVLGATLYDRAGDAVANVLRVQSAADGRVEAVIIDLGGFLGLGGKRIVIPANGLQFRAGRIDAPSLSLEQIRDLPQVAQ